MALTDIQSYLEHIEEGGLWPLTLTDQLGDLDVGASGFGSNYRHSGNVALLKNIISNKIATDTGYSLIDKPTRAIGDVLGGITGWGAGLKHEITGESPIFNENLTNGIFTTDFLEDMAANYYGAMQGKTGITSARVIEEMAKSLATGEDSNLDYLNKLGLRTHLDRIRNLNTAMPVQSAARTWPISVNQTEFRKMFMDRYHKSPSELNRERLENEQLQDEIKQLRAQSLVNWEKDAKGMPEHLSFDTGAGNVPKTYVRPLGPRGDDRPSRPSRDLGRARERGETRQIAGGHHFNRGGPIDIPLPGRSRYI